MTPCVVGRQCHSGWGRAAGRASSSGDRHRARGEGANDAAIIAVITREKASLGEPCRLAALYRLLTRSGAGYRASPLPEDLMNETACLLLIGGAALLMAS